MPSVTAEIIARALGGHRAGTQWMARCLAHDDSSPSLALRDGADGRVLVCCHGGCDQGAVIAALRELGLWNGDVDQRHDIQRLASAATAPPDDKARTVAALRVWCQSVPALGTLVEKYLSTRAINLAPPVTLKFHASLRHPAGDRFPAIVALITNGANNRPIGVHRTYLTGDGTGKASVKPNKMMLGPCRGGSVRLGAMTAPLLIGEGLETCLSAMQATGLSAWAALSTSGMTALVLPTDVRDIVLIADGDPAGERAAVVAAHRFSGEARRVRIAPAPSGTDFNDMLRGSEPDEAA